MKTIEFIGYQDKNCERMAARNGLTFHCDGYFITEHDDDREARPATEPELAMWGLLTGDFDPENLPATPKEVLHSLQYRKGPFTLNAVDVAALRKLENFEPCLDRSELQAGIIGWLHRPPCDYPEDSPWFRPERACIYVSRAIPLGYYYEGPHVPEIHWRPTSEERQVEPDLDWGIECKISLNLKPFMTDWP
jgi:hypothetical protein